MHLLEAVPRRVVLVVELATRKVVVPVALATGDLPRKEARREGVDLVAAIAVAVGHRKGEHRLVLARGVVDKRQTVGHRLDNGLRSVLPGTTRLLGL